MKNYLHLKSEIKNMPILLKITSNYNNFSFSRCGFRYYGINEIVQAVKTLRTIDKKAASFVAAITNIPLRKFKCFSITQSKDQLWNF